MLKPGSRSAGYVIHTPSGLTQAGERRAAELGPPNVTAPLSPDALTRQAGLSVVVLQDVTEDFRATCEALLRTREALAAELRAEEGDDVYEDERTQADRDAHGYRRRGPLSLVGCRYPELMRLIGTDQG